MIVWVSVVALALLTADVVVGGLVSHLDVHLRAAIQPRDDSAPWWLSAVAELGDLRFAIPIVAAGALVASQYAWRLWPAAFAVGTFAAVELAVLGLKAAVGRPGPGMWRDREGYPGYFPSGHTATAAAVVAIALFVIGRLGLIRRPVATEVCVAAGASLGALSGLRAVVGDTHWASDVVGGLLLTAAIVVPAIALCRGFLDTPSERRRQPSRGSAGGPPDGSSTP
jgi:membrane-associated phospholipid phosphatase